MDSRARRVQGDGWPFFCNASAVNDRQIMPVSHVAIATHTGRCACGIYWRVSFSQPVLGMDFGMKAAGKVIVITGAGSGIGRELALLLLTKGAKVAGVDLNAGAVAETGSLAGEHNGDFEPFVANVADRTAVENLPEQVGARFGVVDGIINNAGIIQPFVRVSALDFPTIERVMNVNFFGLLYVTKTFLPTLLERPEAHIVNLSSMGGFIPVPGQTIYCAAKAGVKLLSEGLASELIGTNVHVTVICPGAVATSITANSGVSMPTAQASSGSAARGLSPRAAAEAIVKAMERNAHHAFVGRDSSMMNILHRAYPRFAANAIAKSMAGLLSR